MPYGHYIKAPLGEQQIGLSQFMPLKLAYFAICNAQLALLDVLDNEILLPHVILQANGQLKNGVAV